MTSPDLPGQGAPADPGPSRPGTSTFTIEGRSAPALFVVGWLATLAGGGLILVAVLSAGGASTWLLLAGVVLLGVGLIAGAGSQGIERRVRGTAAYLGPSPFLVFAASIPVSLLAVVLIAIPIGLAGQPIDGPLGRLASVLVQALVYIALIRLLVVDTGALSWGEMGWRRPDTRAIGELLGGAAWALPVIVATIPVSAILLLLFPVTPESPLPPAGSPGGFAINLLAGAVIAPIGEEIMFRGFATTAWARAIGARPGLVRAALFFALAHVITIAGSSLGEAFGLAVVGFATRIPVALALGWLFLRRGSIWAPLGLHSTFNLVLLVIGEVAARPV